jgi:hypothetical protein
MNSIESATLTFVLIFGAASAGFIFQKRLPSHHLSDQSKAAAHLGAGLIATLAALILGLLVSSTKGSYDQTGSLVNEIAASFEHADRLLANYGAEAVPLRGLLRQSLETAHSLVWPEESGLGKNATLNDPSSSKMVLESVYNGICLLKPSNPNQQQLQTDSIHLIDDIIQKRWLLQEIVYGGGISSILLVIPVLFVAFITFVYALYAPRNTTVVAAMLSSSICIAISIFLISELASPLKGVLKISSKPVHVALQHMGKQ